MTSQTTATAEGDGQAMTLEPPAEKPGFGAAALTRLRSAGFAPERQALTWWLLTRLSALWIAANAAWVFARSDAPVGPYLERWYTWDTQYFVKIAQNGYTEIPGDTGVYEAFFPGMPALLWIVHLVVPNWIVAGLLISFVGGAFGVMALARLAEEEYGTGVGGRAVLLLSVSPLAVFMVSGYTESLFLAFAMPAWLQARRGRWAWAAVLGAGASCVRITGLFLAAALIIEFAARWLPERLRGPVNPNAVPTQIWHAGWLIVPFLPIVAYFGYLKYTHGSWMYYSEAQKLGWGREYAGFGKTWDNMWTAATAPGGAPTWQWAYRLEIIAVAVGIALTLYLLSRFRYAEAVYVAASLAALMTSGMYFSTARGALLWWPLWILLATWGAHPRFGTLITRLYLFLSVPLAVFLAAAFTTWRWAG